MRPIIEVKGVSKEFQRGAQQERYLSLRDQIGSLFKPSRKKESFWALKDIDFQVAPGESLAIIGKNGAGKSTLLKILSQITPPTRGEIILRGRLASLLEVGTGFHPELTGKENVFLNGSILGLRRKEIDRQFDAIVDFAGIESFLDTPLKHYSSGMQLRLAFSVAAHLEPEILIIDEVLAVGDSAFQQKCIKKMTEVSQSGRTILFVSHNLQAVRNLCTRGILIHEGVSVMQGSVEEVLKEYTSSDTESQLDFDLSKLLHRRGEGQLRFENLRLEKKNYEIGDQINIRLGLSTNKDITHNKDLNFGLAVVDKLGNTIHHFSNRFLQKEVHMHTSGREYIFSFEIRLKPGFYDIVLFMRASEVIQDWLTVENALNVVDSSLYIHNDSQGVQSLVQTEFNFIVGPNSQP